MSDQQPLTGGCLCGALRYQINRPPIAVYTCHCTDCQHLTGSAFSTAVIVAGAAFLLTGIEPRPLQRTADSGRVLTRWVCPDCGTWICGGPKPGSPQPPEFRTLRAGTLDDTSWIRPTFHFWIRSRQPWITLPPEGQSFDTQPVNFMEVVTSQYTE